MCTTSESILTERAKPVNIFLTVQLSLWDVGWGSGDIVLLVHDFGTRWKFLPIHHPFAGKEPGT